MPLLFYTILSLSCQHLSSYTRFFGHITRTHLPNFMHFAPMCFLSCEHLSMRQRLYVIHGFYACQSLVSCWNCFQDCRPKSLKNPCLGGQIGIYRSLERTVIASQCAHWRGNLVDFRETLVGRICRFFLENVEKSA